MAPTGVRPVGRFVSPPHTKPPGGRGPRRVAPVLGAGRPALLTGPAALLLRQYGYDPGG